MMRLMRVVVSLCKGPTLDSSNIKDCVNGMTSLLWNDVANRVFEIQVPNQKLDGLSERTVLRYEEFENRQDAVSRKSNPTMRRFEPFDWKVPIEPFNMLTVVSCQSSRDTVWTHPIVPEILSRHSRRGIECVFCQQRI